MDFINFLSDNLDCPGRVARFARIIFSDVHNGCGRLEWGAVAWKGHFEEKHPETSPQLIHMLTETYVTYIRTLNQE